MGLPSAYLALYGNLAVPEIVEKERPPPQPPPAPARVHNPLAKITQATMNDESLLNRQSDSENNEDSDQSPTGSERSNIEHLHTWLVNATNAGTTFRSGYECTTSQTTIHDNVDTATALTPAERSQKQEAVTCQIHQSVDDRVHTITADVDMSECPELPPMMKGINDDSSDDSSISDKSDDSISDEMLSATIATLHCEFSGLTIDDTTASTAWAIKATHPRSIHTSTDNIIYH